MPPRISMNDDRPLLDTPPLTNLDYPLTFSFAVLRCLTMETLTIRLPDELRDNLQKLSQEQNKPVSDIVRESIRRYVAVERFRALRKKVLPFAEAQGFLTDEDIFKEIS